VEDFRSDDERRYISAARNYYAGVLLLAKQCLVNQAPEANPMDVIGARYIPVPNGDGNIDYEADGNNTIDFNDIERRFKKFGLEWPGGPVKKLQKLRNNLEHFYLSEPLKNIKEVIAGSFSTVSKLFQLLDKDPSVELGDTWQIMLDEHSFFEEEKAACASSFSKVKLLAPIENFNQLECSKCGSCLLEQRDPKNTDPQEIEARCRSCATDMTAEFFVAAVVDADYGVDAYIAAKDGCDDVITDCPSCNEPTYVSGNVTGCYWCGYKLPDKCVRCHTPLSPSNVAWDTTKLCSYCEHLMHKND